MTGSARRIPPAFSQGAPDSLPPGWIIETLTERDVDDALEVERASFSNPWTREMFLGELQNVGVSRAYVLRTPQWPVMAFCTVWLLIDEIHVNNIAVRPEGRRQGAGRALLRFVLAECASLGGRRATLEVRRSNVAAIKLYEQLGFVVSATRKGYYRNPDEDALILWLEDVSSSEGTGGSAAP